MSPLTGWLAAGALALGVAGFFGGIKVGKDMEIAANAKTDQAIQEDRAATLQIVGEQIAGIKVVNRTNETVFEREIVKVPDFSKCHAGPDALRVLNDALAGRTAEAGPAGGSVLPGIDPAG